MTAMRVVVSIRPSREIERGRVRRAPRRVVDLGRFWWTEGKDLDQISLEL